jgi:hypothetical protein
MQSFPAAMSKHDEMGRDQNRLDRGSKIRQFSTWIVQIGSIGQRSNIIE